MSDAFERLLTDTRAQLERMRARPGQGQPPAVGVGQALDGRVKTAMAADGRLLGMVLDPSLLRMDERELARVIVAAVIRRGLRGRGLTSRRRRWRGWIRQHFSGNFLSCRTRVWMRCGGSPMACRRCWTRSTRGSRSERTRR